MTDPIALRSARRRACAACRWLPARPGRGGRARRCAAIDPDDLLPVDEAFALRAEATVAGPHRAPLAHRRRLLPLSAPHRRAGRRRLRRAAAAAAHGRGARGRVLRQGRDLPPGADRDAAGPGARAPSVTLKIKYQGCADAGICYPPQTRSVTVALPAAAAAPAASDRWSPSARRGGAPLGGGLLGDARPPARPTPCRCRRSRPSASRPSPATATRCCCASRPARGYYLYRDKTSLKLDAAAAKAGIALGAPRWPRGRRASRRAFRRRRRVLRPGRSAGAAAAHAAPTRTTLRLTATFQGCQTDGICYPPMTRTVDVALPAGTVRAGDAPPRRRPQPRHATGSSNATEQHRCLPAR